MYCYRRYWVSNAMTWFLLALYVCSIELCNWRGYIHKCRRPAFDKILGPYVCILLVWDHVSLPVHDGTVLYRTVLYVLHQSPVFDQEYPPFSIL